MECLGDAPTRKYARGRWAFARADLVGRAFHELLLLGLTTDALAARIAQFGFFLNRRGTHFHDRVPRSKEALRAEVPTRAVLDALPAGEWRGYRYTPQLRPGELWRDEYGSVSFAEVESSSAPPG